MGRAARKDCTSLRVCGCMNILVWGWDGGWGWKYMGLDL